MICALYTLLGKYKDKKVYVWNTNRTSMVLFVKLAFTRVNIHGFVTEQEEHVGERYMNRPVVSLKQIEQEDYIIIVADEVPRDRIMRIPDSKAVYWSDALGINEELRNRKIIIYGTGKGADKICEVLSKNDLEAELYCVTKRENITCYKGKKVIEVTELEDYGECSVIISVKRERYRKEILETLSRYRGYIFVEQIIDKVCIGQINLIQNIDLALKKHRKIYLYGRRTAIGELIEEVLQIYGIEVNGYVYDVKSREQRIESIYTLALEGIEDKLIIIIEMLEEHLVRARENIELAGFSLESGSYTGLQYYTAASDSILEKVKTDLDILTGASILYSHGRPGWKLYGKEEEERIRILVLGGSTSSEVYHPENWISKLYHKLNRRNIKTTIYNGAHAGDDVIDELLRLLRDGYILYPQIVISMSGVNNTYYKECANQFNPHQMIEWARVMQPDQEFCSGVHSDESLYSFWNRNEKLLELVSNFYGAAFLSFLQPMNITMDHMTLWEKSTYELEAHIAGAREFADSANDNDNYINLMRLFEHKDEMYIDSCHYTDRAQEIIADKVYEAIIPLIETLE